MCSAKIFFLLMAMVSSTVLAENQAALIQSVPSSAKIFIDGKDSKKTTPSRIDGINADSRIVLKKECFEDIKITQAMIKYRGTAKLVRLKDAKCAEAKEVITVVVVNSSPSGAEIYVDGQDTGRDTPARIDPINAKTVFTIKKEGFEDCIIKNIDSRSVSCDLKRQTSK